MPPRGQALRRIPGRDSGLAGVGARPGVGRRQILVERARLLGRTAALAKLKAELEARNKGR